MKIHNNKNGFTLLELLISLTILSVIVVITLGALQVGVRAWEKGEKDVDAHQRHRIVLDLIKQQLSSVNVKKLDGQGVQPFLFKGDSKSIEFVSRVSLNPSNTLGNVYVKYVVRKEEKSKERLVFFEKNTMLLDRHFNPTDLDDDDFYELIPEIHSVVFEYLKTPGKTGEHEWQENWNPKEVKGLPVAIKTILQENDTTAPITMIVRVMSEEDT